MSGTIARRLDFSDVTLYGVTSAELSAERLLEQTKKALAGGVDAIQLRTRNMSDRELLMLGTKL
jgi:thiamine monophosphate synthase